MRALAIVLLAPVALTACVDKRSFESVPVEIETPQGTVTCQLYGVNQILWDRAIERPTSMSDEEANAVCVQRGKEIISEL